MKFIAITSTFLSIVSFVAGAAIDGSQFIHPPGVIAKVINKVLAEFKINVTHGSIAKKDLKAIDLRNLIKDNPDGKWPEEQHGKI
ncbi:hypothetical protein M422DRAFT_262675 [Sphaerobolus stellatus SS14]|uniref:Uncharacterized protein n=1 Tax=Sphaerobolus stellatus (strain SS14) TaxID=990650 RepID=A0A0C9VC56_SPHS4|nr:hypothetical protein M422DRAFT_262675 [Sphaerobolus stellatus SS14]